MMHNIEPFPSGVDHPWHPSPSCDTPGMASASPARLAPETLSPAGLTPKQPASSQRHWLAHQPATTLPVSVSTTHQAFDNPRGHKAPGGDMPMKGLKAPPASDIAAFLYTKSGARGAGVKQLLTLYGR